MTCKKRIVRVSIIGILLLFLSSQFLIPQKGNESKMDRLFKMSIEELMQVEISTAGKRPDKIGDIPASVVLITREDIEIYGYQSLPEILQNIPGLFAIDDYVDDGLNFGVRGFWSGVANDNIIILVNGVHQVNDFHSNYPMSKIVVPVQAIDRIEVIRGPMSVIYGNGAFFGVINIITNDNSFEAVNMLGASAGSLENRKMFARIAGHQGDLSYVFNASITSTAGMDNALIDMAGNPDILAALNVPVNSRTGGRLGLKERYFDFSGTLKGVSVDMSYNDVEKQFYFSFPSVDEGSLNHISVGQVSLKYQKEFSSRMSLEGKLTYAQKRDSYTYDFLFKDFYGVQQLEMNGWEAELNAFIRPNDKLDIRTGLYYRSVFKMVNRYDLPSFGGPSLENNYFFLEDGDQIVTRSLFAQVTYTPTKHLNLVAGVRLEQTPKYGLGMTQTHGAGPPVKQNEVFKRENIEVIPRLAALIHLDDYNVFKFLYGKAINRPSFFQNTRNTLDPAREDLDPESITTFELNYIGKMTSRFTVNASIFRNSLRNLITRVVRLDDQGNYQSWSDNAGEMVTHGVELTLITEPVDNFRLELSGTLQKTKDKTEDFENIEVAYSPKALGYLKASFRSMKFAASVTGNYVGAMETYWDQLKPDTDGVIRDGARIGEKVEDYFMLGANLRFHDLLMDGVFLNIRCSNLLDEEIRYPTFTNNDWAVKGTLGLGRTFLVTLGCQF